MKVTVVPAQVTTVEDRIAGSLSFSQMMLLALPVFGGGLLYIVLPPYGATSIYKIVILTVFAVLCGVLAIRIRGKIVLNWLAVLIRYKARPKYYLFDKRSIANREQHSLKHASVPSMEINTDEIAKEPIHKLAFADAMRVMTTIENPASHIRFETTKKGGLRVHLAEVKEQN